jgi:zinc transport system ATP-binding protein
MIDIRNLNYTVQNKTILQDINLTIQGGEFVAMLGPNGAGKSTLLKIILGLIRDYSGQILIEQKPHFEWLRKNIIGYLPQSEQFDTDFPATALEIILMGYAGIRGLFHSLTQQDRDKALQCLQTVGLSGKENYYIGHLSGGEYQRVMLARALITDSNILFLDEPEANLDKSGVSDFFELLKTLNERGKTIVVVSHDINILSKYTNYLICLNKTLHCHDKMELLNADVIKKTYGEIARLIEKDY